MDINMVDFTKCKIYNRNMKRLKELRKLNNMTLKTLGKKLNLSESTISLYESGQREPDFQTVCAIAKLFNVTVDYLIGNDEEELSITKKNKIIFLSEGEGKKEFEVSDNEMKALKYLIKTIKNDFDD